VADFGIGISPSELETIFIPFSRGQNVALTEGTGLGLTIVKEAIEVMKASITVKSSFVSGASFIVKIRK
jgi:signal transduction histidine kinase